MTKQDRPQGPGADASDVLGPTLPARDGERPAPDSHPQIHARTIKPGFILQHYEIIRPLGSGGMGAVFLARDLHLGRRVAIKLLLRHSGKAAARFLVEARATARLSHENIVVIHELGDHLGTPYMVLEHLEGRTLQQLLRERQRALRAESPPEPETRVDAVKTAELWARDDVATDGSGGRPEPSQSIKAPSGLPPERAVALMLPVVRALVSAHEHGLVHLDLKPSNIMVTNTGVVKVLDFGIAKLLDPLDGSSTEGPAAEPAVNTTGLTGTMPYMSPEQWGSGLVTHRSDIWAVGIVLAELVLGRHPLDPLSLDALGTIRRLDVPMPCLCEAFPSLGRLAEIIDRCLIKASADRMGSARELQAELEALGHETRAAAIDTEQNPYAGLASFREGDGHRFFGRTAAVGELLAQLEEQPLVTIIGPSGIGKSSFVRAGLIATLGRMGDAWEALTLRPGPHPLRALAELLLSSALRTTGQDDDAELHAASPLEDRDALATTLRSEPGLLGTRLRWLARRHNKRVLLFVDQLEELYTLAPEPDRIAFIACLVGVADDVGSPLRVVLALRSDFLDRLAEIRAVAATLQHGILLLPPMDRDGLREALVCPLEALEHRFDHPRLIEEMLDAVEHTSGALPLLSFAAAKLWEQRDRARRRLTQESYQRIGGVAGTLARHADAVLGAMSAEDRALARTALLALITPERTRALRSLEEMHEVAASRDGMQTVLGRLTDARLLTIERSGDAGAMVELVHESLITAWPTLAGWIAESQADAAFLARVRNAAREWEASGRSVDLLWRGQAALDARRWYEQHTANDLSALERRYLEAMSALTKRTQLLRRRIIGGTLATLAAVVVAVSSLAIIAREQAQDAQQQAAWAERETRHARDATRMAAARALRSDPTTALALLREVEGPEVPRGWSQLTHWALHANVARVVLTHPDVVTSAAFSPDGTRIVTTSADPLIRVWNADGTGEPLLLHGHYGMSYFAAFSPDGARIVTASWDATARVWNADGTDEPLVLRGHEARVLSAAFSPDGRRIVTGSYDGTARVWNADGTGEPTILLGHERAVYSAAFSPDGARVVTSSADETARVWSANGTGEPRILLGHEKAVASAAFSPDGRYVVTGSWDTTARVWDADGNGEPRVLRGHENIVYSAAFSPDGTRIVTASLDKTARVWSTAGTDDPLVLRGHGSGVSFATFSPDGTHIVTASFDKTARVWRAMGGSDPLLFRDHQEGLTSIAFSADGTRLVTTSSKMARVWRSDGKGEPVSLCCHGDTVYDAMFSPDGTHIVTASWDGTARVWNADGTGEPLVLRGHEDRVHQAAFSPDGTRIVTASWDATARVWNADGSGGPVVLRGHEALVFSAAFSPDGTRIVTAAADETVRVWNADGTGQSLLFRGHDGEVFSAAFSPDGTHIVTASSDDTARVWNAAGTGEPLVLRGHEHWVVRAAFNPDGTRIVTASVDQTVRVWNADGTGEPLILSGATDAYVQATFSPDGKRIAAASGDGTVWSWHDLEPLRGVDDPRLWTATTYCMPVDVRMELLGISQDLAHSNWQACRLAVQ